MWPCSGRGWGGGGGGGLGHACESKVKRGEEGGYSEAIPLQMERQGYISAKNNAAQKGVLAFSQTLKIPPPPASNPDRAAQTPGAAGPM